MNCIHSISRGSPREGDQRNQKKSAKPVNCKDCTHPSNPWTASKRSRHVFPVIYSQPQRSRQLSAAPNQHQLPPPDSSTKSALASSFHHQATVQNQHLLPVSSTRQQHQTSISFQFLPPSSSTTSASLQQGIQPISC